MKQYLSFRIHPNASMNELENLGIRKKDCKFISETKVLILAEPQQREEIELVLLEEGEIRNENEF